MPHPQPSIQASSTNTPTTYFGYGSNLWLHQMLIRCPTSQYLGVARLNKYKWIINDRGYANVVELSKLQKKDPKEKDGGGECDGEDGEGRYDDVVFGLVYSLEEEDERRLDRNEGVPVAYTKELLECDFWKSRAEKWVDTSKAPDFKCDMLVYIDRERLSPGEPRKEYVYRMNQGIADALKMGVPERYVEDVMRKFIPEGKDGEERRSVEEFAAKQAARFKDESGVFQ